MRSLDWKGMVEYEVGPRHHQRGREYYKKEYGVTRPGRDRDHEQGTRCSWQLGSRLPH